MRIIYKISLILVLILANSCDESLLDQTNPNQFTSDQYYTCLLYTSPSPRD